MCSSEWDTAWLGVVEGGAGWWFGGIVVGDQGRQGVLERPHCSRCHKMNSYWLLINSSGPPADRRVCFLISFIRRSAVEAGKIRRDSKASRPPSLPLFLPCFPQVIINSPLPLLSWSIFLCLTLIHRKIHEKKPFDIYVNNIAQTWRECLQQKFFPYCVKCSWCYLLM